MRIAPPVSVTVAAVRTPRVLLVAARTVLRCGAIGGAMDLVSGGRTVMVLMAHCERNGDAKLVKHCTLPYTGVHCVDIVVTDLCVLRREDGRFRLEQVAPGFSAEEVISLATMSIDV